MKPRTRLAGIRYAVIALALGAALLGAGLGATRLAVARGAAVPEAAPKGTAAPAAAGSAVIERGRYLAALGDCAACHTAPGKPEYAGGRALPTPYGVFYPPNITPDPTNGIGGWSEADFYRAMHDGIGPGGKLLYPAFPFPAYSRMTRADVDAIWAYLRTVPPVNQPNEENELRWPYSKRGLMRVWRALYFKPGTFQPDPKKSAEWNHGAYLVQGVGHCGACHTPRNRLGALVASREFAGGTITIDNWRAPNISQDPGHGIGDWSTAEVRAFLKGGTSPRGDAIGPMRDVVETGLQHLTEGDLDAIVTYLTSVPAQPDLVRNAMSQQQFILTPTAAAEAAKLYHDECAACHGDDGRAKPHFPDLRGNAIVRSEDPRDLILQILHGGFQATTKDNPYPYSMPPFGARLTDDQIARVASYVRRNFGNHASLVFPFQVRAMR